jgi:glutamate-1-semialdehyde 2,1-aminomutase
VPSVEQVRFVSSGTEAGMTALRLARGVTGRPKVLKFAGHYHGHSDALLAAAGSGVATLGLPGSAGVTAGAVADTIVVGFNDESGLDAAFAKHAAELAAVFVEPVAANMGLVSPAPGFLDSLRRRCTEAGALLVFDEVITGFRIGPAGAQGRFGITPDLTMFGKVVGGGLPLAAVGGPTRIMEHLAPVGSVYQAGTLSGNPLATAAGLATLALLDDDAYARLEAIATQLAEALATALKERDAQVIRVGTLVGVSFTPEPVLDYEGACRADEARYARWFHGLLDGGVYVAPSAFETMFPSLAHGDEELERTALAATRAASGI